MKPTAHLGDCVEVLATMEPETFDSVVCDPPYHLTAGKKGGSGEASVNLNTPYGRSRITTGFMGKQWDGGDVAFRPETWAAIARVMKPGAYLVAFGGTRTVHRMACAIEDAGLEIRDSLLWLYGSGFAKVGMLKNRHPELWCKCDADPNLSSLRPTIPATFEPRGAGEGGDLLATVQRASSRPGMEEACAQGPRGVEPRNGGPLCGERAGRGEPGMEGRALRRAGQGLCNGAQPSASESEEERLCVRAHTGCGENARPPADGDRRGSSHQSESSGQSTGKSESVREPSRALDGGALRGRGECPRCGGISQDFNGFGGSLKPAHEPIILARKPLAEKTVAANVLKHGVGALNVDGCRVATNESTARPSGTNQGIYGADNRQGMIRGGSAAGRFPPNVLHDGSPEVLEAFARFGVSKSTDRERKNGDFKSVAKGKEYAHSTFGHADTGTAARFFPELGFHYSGKATKADRAGSSHPTIKPQSLMRWLCRLVTPPGGHVLDPFAGSGSTLQAAWREGFRATGIELTPEHFEDIQRRLRLLGAFDDGLFAGMEECA